jgi:uncharacterized membrane protein
MRVPVRRLIAFGVDYLMIAAYLLVLLGVSLAALASPARNEYLAVRSNAWSAEVGGFILLTAPVVLYFADSRCRVRWPVSVWKSGNRLDLGCRSTAHSRIDVCW